MFWLFDYFSFMFYIIHNWVVEKDLDYVVKDTVFTEVNEEEVRSFIFNKKP